MKKGFTLTELLITIVIIAILMMFVLPTLGNLIKKNNKELCESYEKMVMEYAKVGNLKDMIDDKNVIMIDELDGLDTVKEHCQGYILVDLSSDPYEYTPYLKCDNECVTEGYSADVNGPSFQINNPGTCNNNVYDGTSKTLVSGGEHVTYVNNTGTEVGSYTVTINAEKYYVFDDGKTSRTMVCNIAPKTLTCPSSPADKTYTGSSQNSGITCPTGSTAGGTQSAINVGEYTQTCTANTNYQFASNCSVNWKIIKGDCDLVVAKSGATLVEGEEITTNVGNAFPIWSASNLCPNFNVEISDTSVLGNWPSNETPLEARYGSVVGFRGVGGGTTNVTISTSGDNYNTKTFTFKVKVNAVKDANTGSCNTLTYTGSDQTLASGGSNVTYSNNTGKAATTYNVTVNANTGHLFSDGTDSKTLSCTITPKILTCPSSPADKAYTGSSQNSGITCPTGSTAGGTQSATNGGEYTQTCTANANYQFATSCSVKWKIVANDATTGSCNNLTYTGEDQTLAGGGSNVTYSDNTGKNATSYTVTVNANTGHTFSDKTTSKTLNCSIKKVDSTIKCQRKSYTSGTLQAYSSATGCSSIKVTRCSRIDETGCKTISGSTTTGGTVTSGGIYKVTCKGDSNHNDSSCNVYIVPYFRFSYNTGGTLGNCTYNCGVNCMLDPNTSMNMHSCTTGENDYPSTNYLETGTYCWCYDVKFSD